MVEPDNTVEERLTTLVAQRRAVVPASDYDGTLLLEEARVEATIRARLIDELVGGKVGNHPDFAHLISSHTMSYNSASLLQLLEHQHRVIVALRALKQSKPRITDDIAALVAGDFDDGILPFPAARGLLETLLSDPYTLGVVLKTGTREEAATFFDEAASLMRGGGAEPLGPTTEGLIANYVDAYSEGGARGLRARRRLDRLKKELIQAEYELRCAVSDEAEDEE